jgi:Raf kinase inhibitor-like YbhB/YbcL family protein
MKISRILSLALSMLLLLASSALLQECKTDSTSKKSEVKMKITSPAFKEGESIPGQFSCDGPDISPPLSFVDVPAGAKSLALICDDPDAPVGDWVHWVIYNIPPNVKVIPENVPKQLTAKVKIDDREIALSQGITDFRKFGYGGPCPPGGRPHRYYFKLYALDSELKFESDIVKTGITKAILMEKMKGHILAETSLMGKYIRVF